MSDCSNCVGHHFCGYPDSVWFPMSALNPLCRVQMIFLIEHLEMLEEGKYPANPKPTGYTGIDPAIRIKPRSTPLWLVVAELAAEIEDRLSTCGDAGEALVDEVQHGRGEVVTVDCLSRPARKALNYISGSRRRALTFAQWKAKETFRSKKNGR